MNVDAILEGIATKDVADLGDSVPDEVRGKTPDELAQLVEIMDAHLRSLHQEENGEIRDLTLDESRAFQYGLKVREAAIKRLEDHRSLTEVFSRRPNAVKKVYANLRNGLEGRESVLRMTNTEARDAAYRVLDERRSSDHLAADQKDEVGRQIRRSPDIARRVLVTENEAYRNAWMKLMAHGNEAMMLLEDEERDAMRNYMEYRAASEGSTTAGGFAIPVFIDPSVIMTAQGSGNPFLKIAKQVEVNTNAWKGVNSAGVTWSFDAENTEVSDDAPSILQPSVTVFMARGFIPFSIEIGMDWPGYQSEMATLLAEGYDELLVDKFTRGSGTGEPKGVVTAISAVSSLRVGIQTSGQAFGANDPYNVWKALPQRFRRNASWLMTVDVNNKIRQIGTANVFHAYTTNLPTEWADQLFGKQTYESPYMLDTTTSTSANSVLALVGDFRNGYTIARRSGMSTELIPHIFSNTTNLPEGKRGLFAYARIGGDVVNTSAFRALVNT